VSLEYAHLPVKVQKLVMRYLALFAALLLVEHESEPLPHAVAAVLHGQQQPWLFDLLGSLREILVDLHDHEWAPQDRLHGLLASVHGPAAQQTFCKCQCCALPAHE